QLSEPLEGELHHHLGGSVPGHLRLQPAGHCRLSGALRAIAVSELFHAPGKRPSQMARGRARSSGAQSGLDLLPAHHKRNPQLPGWSVETRVLGRGTRPRLLQLIVPMADPTNTPRQPELPSETHSAAERNRRRVIQRGLAAAPLLMTLLSRPVLGQVQCFAPSAAVSIPTSTHGATILCSGRAPGFWADPLNFS